MSGRFDEQTCLSNSKSECRNSKQAQRSKGPKFKTVHPPRRFGTLRFRSLGFVSDFGFRVSDFKAPHGLKGILRGLSDACGW
jgi:hypothetical protein